MNSLCFKICWLGCESRLVHSPWRPVTRTPGSQGTMQKAWLVCSGFHPVSAESPQSWGLQTPSSVSFALSSPLLPPFRAQCPGLRRTSVLLPSWEGTLNPQYLPPPSCPSTGSICKIKWQFSPKMVSQRTLSMHHYGKRASSCLRQGCQRNGIPRDATSQNHYSGDRNSPSRRPWFMQPGVFSTVF